MFQLAIIIPCYNEQDSIYKLVGKCILAAKGRTDVQFVFIDNGSIDKTGDVLRNEIFINKFINAKVLTVPVNKGYGYGIKYGLVNSQANILAWTHADLQTDPIDVIHAFDLYKDKLYNTKCIVKGARKNRPFFDNLFTIGMTFFSSIYLKKTIWDINAQPKLFHKNSI